MPVTATTSQGILLKVNNSGYQNIAQVVGITGPTSSWTFDDVTNLDSLAAEVLPIILQGGSVTFDLIWNGGDTQHAFIRAAHQAATKLDFNVVWPFTVPITDQFFAYVGKFETKGEQGKAMRASCELMITGAVTST